MQCGHHSSLSGCDVVKCFPLRHNTMGVPQPGHTGVPTMMLFQIIATREVSSPIPTADATIQFDAVDMPVSENPCIAHFESNATTIAIKGAAANTVRNLRLMAGRFEHTTFQASIWR